MTKTMFLFNKLIGVILGRKKNNYSAVAVINSSACHIFTVTLCLPASPPPGPNRLTSKHGDELLTLCLHFSRLQDCFQVCSLTFVVTSDTSVPG